MTKVLAGGTISVTGVPPGTGTRLGIDRNANGVLDGDEPLPTLQIVCAATNAIVAWPTNAAGFVLETTVALPAPWATETSVRGVVGTEFNVTNALAPNGRFFRLKGL